MQRIIGIDFTSVPGENKPITVAHCLFDEKVLKMRKLSRLTTFKEFEKLLHTKGPWVAGLDFPFSFSREFLIGIGWPQVWSKLAAKLGAMKKCEFEKEIEEWRERQPVKRKHLKRKVDKLCGGASPNNIVNPPVGKMLFQGVPRLHQAKLTIPGLASGDQMQNKRIAIEAYPAPTADVLIGTRAYKEGNSDAELDRIELRRKLLCCLSGDAGRQRYGFVVEAPERICIDRKGDDLDALICAVQAAWAVVEGYAGKDGPVGADTVEGWIAEPKAINHVS